MVYKSMDGLRPTRLGQREPKASESRGSRDETEASLDFAGKTVCRRRIGRNFARGRAGKIYDPMRSAARAPFN